MLMSCSPMGAQPLGFVPLQPFEAQTFDQWPTPGMH